MVSLIRQTPHGAASIATSTDSLALNDVALLAPITRPSKNVLCVGLNYHAHASEFSSSGYDTPRERDGQPTPSHPIVFTKAFGSLNGPYADIVAPWDITQEVDYEAELGVIIGRAGRAISEANAYDHVWATPSSMM